MPWKSKTISGNLELLFLLLSAVRQSQPLQFQLQLFFDLYFPLSSRFLFNNSNNIIRISKRLTWKRDCHPTALPQETKNPKRNETKRNETNSSGEHCRTRRRKVLNFIARTSRLIRGGHVGEISSSCHE